MYTTPSSPSVSLCGYVPLLTEGRPRSQWVCPFETRVGRGLYMHVRVSRLCKVVVHVSDRVTHAITCIPVCLLRVVRVACAYACPCETRLGRVRTCREGPEAPRGCLSVETVVPHPLPSSPGPNGPYAYTPRVSTYRTGPSCLCGHW